MTVTDAYEQHQSYLLRVAYGMVGNMADAEDMVSMMWVRVLPHWDRLEDTNLRGYLWQTLKRLNIDRRWIRYAVSFDSVPDWAGDGHPYSDYVACQISLDTIVESRERLRDVIAALKALREDEQHVVALAVERWGAKQGLPNRQRVALHRARKHLRETG